MQELESHTCTHHQKLQATAAVIDSVSHQPNVTGQHPTTARYAEVTTESHTCSTTVPYNGPDAYVEPSRLDNGLVLLATPVPLILRHTGVAWLTAHALCRAVYTHTQIKLTLGALAATPLALVHKALAGGCGGGLGCDWGAGLQALQRRQDTA